MWADQHGIHPYLTKLGKPTHTAYIDRFNRTYRDKVFACDWFNSLTEVRELTDIWMAEYHENERMSH